MSDDRYLVSARKYRPDRFADLVAQEHVASTLRNALIQDRLAHAYLFSGPRGVGKTTAARILARAINCKTPLEKRDNGEPCGTCSICQSFESGGNLNIIEIDAASNNSVDDVRSLREKVRIPPQGTQKKVYIIDEVHMLSTQAFNALLKTLEEPPPHVLFIFATTEPNKVLPTILSRCQRFDFHRIPVSDIVDRLRYICRKEDITYDEESLMLIAKKGNGALRDALSVFDQAISLCGMDLQYDELARALGVVDLDLFFKVTELTRAQNSAGMIRLVDEIVVRGYDLLDFLGGLSEHLRNLLVAQTTGSTNLIRASATNKARYKKAAQAFQEPDLLRLLMIASQTASDVKSSTQPRLQVELALLKMTHLERTADLERLLEKIEELEELAADGPLPERESSSPGDETPDRETVREETPSYGENIEPSDETSSDIETPGDRRETTDPDSSSQSSPGDDDETSSVRSSDPDASESSADSNVLGTPALKRQRSPSPSENNPDAGPSAPSRSGPRADSDPTTVVAEPPPETRDASAELKRIQHGWEQLVANVKEEKRILGLALAEARADELSGNRLQIRVPRQYARDRCIENKELLRRKLEEMLLNDAPQLTFVVDETLADNEDGEPSAAFDPFQHVKQLRENDPVIKEIFDRFGGEFVYE
jgi:DNA polymerase-3 subunit gamma/tau